MLLKILYLEIPEMLISIVFFRSVGGRSRAGEHGSDRVPEPQALARGPRYDRLHRQVHRQSQAGIVFFLLLYEIWKIRIFLYYFF